MKRILSLLLVMCLLLSAVPFAAAAEVPTEEAAYEAMIAYKEIYPEGTPWGDTQYYEWNGGIYAGGTGCVAFAFMLSDAAFGDLPARMVETVVFSEVRVGDILRMENDTHSVIVLETHEDYVVLAEGSYNASVHWGRILTVEQVEGSDFLLTRYPEGTGDDDGPTDSIIPDDAVVIGTGNCGEDGLPNVKWTLCEDGTLYLTGIGPTREYLSIFDKPDWYDHADSITRVVVQDGITAIGSRTFANHAALTEVILPDSVTEIDLEAFQSCTALTAIDLPENLTKIDSRAFQNCTALANVTFPESLKTINVSAFEGSGLTEAILPEGVTYIGSSAFKNCDALKRVYIPGTVINDFQYLCWGCDLLEQVTFGEGVRAIGAYAFADSGLCWLEIPDGISEIGRFAFDNCEYLQVLTIPSTVTWLGQSFADTCYNRLSCVYFDGTREQFDAVEIERSTPSCSFVLVDQQSCAHTSTTTLDEIPAACTYGITEGTICAACGKVLHAPTLITELNHQWTEWYAVDEYTERRTCTSCRYSETRQIPQPKHPFVDVETGAFYEEPVIWAVENNITSGTDATHFSPNGICNRAQVVTFLWRAAECPEPRNTKHSFVDVQAGSFYEKAVLWAVENGITTGTDATHFSPNAACNRATVVTFLWRAADCPEPASGTNPFSDVPAVSWYTEPVLWAVENGITNGLSATQFGPTASCNRAQVVTFLYRAFAE